MENETKDQRAYSNNEDPSGKKTLEPIVIHGLGSGEYSYY